MRAFFRQQRSDLFPNAARAAHNQGDLSAELSFGRHALKFCFLERPVFNAERLRARKRNVIVELRELFRLFRCPCLWHVVAGAAIFECIRASHHVNGIKKEFGGDARFLLVFAKSKQAEARHDYHGGAGISQFRRIRCCPFVVILFVVGSVFRDLFVNVPFENRQILAGRVPPDKERAYFCSQEVVRATRA